MQRTSSVRSLTPVWQILIRFGKFTGKVLIVICPQLIVSLIAIMCYARAGLFPYAGVALHLAAIAFGQLIFFGIWAQATRIPKWRARRWIHFTLASTFVLKSLALNFVYATSYATFQLWHSYLTWANLRTSSQHIIGFHQTLGVIVPVALLAFSALTAGLFAIYYHRSPRILHGLAQAVVEPSSRQFTTTLVSVAGLTTIALWYIEPSTAHILPKDPIYSFWNNNPAKEPALTPEMLAENLANDFHPPKQFFQRNVIIIIIDCLRRDHLSLYGYSRETTPFLHSLMTSGEAQSVAFAIANGNNSPQGIRSVLGSRLPHQQRQYNFKIHDALKRAGYRTHLIAAGDHTSLSDMRKHYGPNFDVFRDGLNPSPYTVNDDRRILSELRELKPFDGRPAFFYFHLMSAHGLSVRQPEYQRWQPSALILDWIPMITGHYDSVLMQNTYDNGLLQADHVVTEIYSALKSKGYLDDYVGVVTGDHGEGLGERGHFGHTGFLYMEDIGVPIIFIESDKVDYGPMPLASHIDIAPTLLSRLGLPLPAQWQGQSLFHAPPPEAVFAESRKNGEDWRTVMIKHDNLIYKYIYIGSPQAGVREMLFNLTADPAEQTNLLAVSGEHEQLSAIRELARRQFNLSITPAE